ncbi:MAG TPA: hypothetical protein VLK24_08240 [Gaiellaceae bacterium]|nr:hypothetical protein [Gaiellaceae bacterium]
MRISLAALAVVLLAGCGSSQPRLTKAEFTQRATAICSRYGTYLQGLRSNLTAGNAAQAQAAIAQVLPIVRSGIDELQTLRPPQELQDAYDRWLAATDLQLKTVERMQKAAQKNDLAGMVAAIKTLGGTDLQQLQVDSATLGLTGCASS